MLMMFPVQCYPLNRAALHGKHAQRRQNVLHRPRTLERPVRQQAVISDANSNSTENGMHHQAQHNRPPASVPERGHHTEVYDNEENYPEDRKKVAFGAFRSVCQRKNSAMSQRIPL